MRFSYTDHAVVVRSYDLKEADRIFVLLTREHGLVRAVAKGVRRTQSRFGARLSRFILLNITIYPGNKDLGTISSAEVVEYMAGHCIENYDKYSAGIAILEAASRVSIQPDAAIFDRTVQALRDINDAPDHAITPILDSFLLNLVELSGWTPQLFECAQCEKPGPHHYFSPALGGAVCQDCKQQGQPRIHPQTLRYMWWLAHNRPMDQWDGPDVAAQAHEQVRLYVQWHVEHGLKALSLFNRGHAY